MPVPEAERGDPAVLKAARAESNWPSGRATAPAECSMPEDGHRALPGAGAAAAAGLPSATAPAGVKMNWPADAAAMPEAALASAYSEYTKSSLR